jgi:hypothetical protein
MGAPSRIAAEKAKAESPEQRLEEMRQYALQGNENAAQMYSQALQAGAVERGTAATMTAAEAARKYEADKLGVEARKLLGTEGYKRAEAAGNYLDSLNKAAELFADTPPETWTERQKKLMQVRDMWDTNYSRMLEKLMLGEVEGKAEGGAIGYAGGGMVDTVEPPNMLARQYGQYVSSAMQAGVQPLSMDKFTALLLKTRTQMAQAPAQTGAPNMQQENPGSGASMGFADGGRVPAWDVLRQRFGFASQNERQVTPQQAARAVPLGSGQLQQAVQLVDARNRNAQIEQQYRQAMGYASGGAIDVSGRQVLGAGDGKSDSIPAVIDGQKPAALSTGEFVFPVEAVQFFGMDRLNKMVAAARKQGQNA